MRRRVMRRRRPMRGRARRPMRRRGSMKRLAFGGRRAGFRM